MPKYILTLQGNKVVGAALTRDDYSGPKPYAELADASVLTSSDLVCLYEWDGNDLVERKKADMDKEVADREKDKTDRVSALQAAWDSLGLDWTPEQCKAIKAKLNGVI